MAENDEIEVQIPRRPTRRRYPRLADPPVKGSLAVRSEARVVDLSLHGIGLESDDGLRPLQSYSLRLADSDDTVRIRGTTVWNRFVTTRRNSKGEMQAVFRGGLRFDNDPADPTTERLRQFLVRNALRSRGGRPRQRFELGPLPPVEFETTYDVEVKNISAGGMLVETKNIPLPPSPLRFDLRIGSRQLVTFGRLIYSERSALGAGPSTRLAVEFEDLSEEDRERLASLVETGLRRQESQERPQLAG